MNLQHSETWSSHAGNNLPSHSIIGTHSTKSFLGLFSYHFILFFLYDILLPSLSLLFLLLCTLKSIRIESHIRLLFIYLFIWAFLSFFRWYIKKSIKQMCVFNQKRRRRIRAIIKASLKQNITIKGKWEIFVQEIWKND